MSGRVKVLVVIGQLELGGTEKHLLNVLPAINKAPLDITIYALRGGGRLQAEFLDAGVRVVSPAHHTRRWAGLVRTSWHLLATWRRERPDIVHFFLPEAYLLGGLCSLVAPKCRRLMSRRSLNDYQQKRPGTRTIERFLHRRVDGILANSTAIARQLRDEGVPESKLAILHNGVDSSDPQNDDDLRGALGISAAATVFVMVANLIPYKGHEDAISAFALARERLPADWAVLFVGEDCGIQAECKRAVHEAGLSDHVHWLGRLDDTRPALAAADIAVHVSHEEGFSNAVLEAMAATLPVIATRVGGNVDAVVDGVTGMLVAPRAPAAIAEALVALAGEPALRTEMGRAACARVVEHYSMSECRAAYRRLYIGVAGGGSMRIGSLISDSVRQ